MPIRAGILKEGIAMHANFPQQILRRQKCFRNVGCIE
jgi:hypothetical protein